jgi:enamine deaminase RidA (YjgF/YER057c/UK114 family)
MSVTINALNPSSVWQVPDAFRSVYTHATEVKAATTMLFISGQFGVRPDGSLPETFSAQATQAMENVEALLAASGMSFANVGKLKFFLTRNTDAPDLVKARSARWGQSQPPAVTVLTVSALARPEYLIEIEATAFA